MGILGIDFGTSNSAIAWASAQGKAQLIPLEGQALAMPTAVFYNAEEQSTHFGRDAIAHYLEGTEGRLMRSLKSLLGSPLLMETTVINNQLVNFSDIIATYLAELREVPNRVFFDLATWHLINWQYQPKAMAQAKALQVNYSNVRLHDRLMRVLTERLGHRMAHGVEQAKILCSQNNSTATIELTYLEANLAASLSPADIQANVGQLLANIVACARECVERANLARKKPDAIYLTGGSSALRTFQQALKHEFIDVPLVVGDLFGGVASGLVYGIQSKPITTR